MAMPKRLLTQVKPASGLEVPDNDYALHCPGLAIMGGLVQVTMLLKSKNIGT